MEQLTIEKTEGPASVRLLKLSGPFTLQSIWDFQAATREGDAAITIIDVTNVPYMDSAALGSLMGVHVSCQRLARKYAIVGVNERVATLFSVADVSNILIQYPSSDDALKAFGA